MPVELANVDAQPILGGEQLVAVGTRIDHRSVLEVLGLNVAEGLVPARGTEIADKAHKAPPRLVGDLCHDFELPGCDRIYKKTQ